MKANVKLLSAACAAALASFAGTATAQAVLPFDTPDVVISVSGASAPQNTIGAVATGLFEPGFHTFFDNANGSASLTDDGALFRAYFGRIKVDGSIPANLHGKTARIENRAQGGSVIGVGPVARATPISNMVISAANCTGPVATPPSATLIYRCGTPTTSTNLTVPDAGVSDIAPKFFLDPLNTEPGTTQLSAAEQGVLDVQGLQGLAMGIVATNAVPATTVFTRDNYQGLLSGTYFDWNLVDSTIPAGTGVTVCRRVNGSGTQSSYNWFFHNFPCGQGVVTGASQAPFPLTMADSSGGLNTSTAGTSSDPFILTHDPAGVTIVENSSSGQVRGCLAAANNGGTHNFTDGAGKSVRVVFPAGTLAVGVLSLDSAGSNPGYNTAWTFRNLGGAGRYDVVAQAPIAGPGTGVAPSKASMKSGAYEFISELTGQYRNTTVAGVPPLSTNADKFALVNELFERLGAPENLNAITSAGVRNANIALPSSTANPRDADPLIAANVANGSRGGLDAITNRPSGNICAPVVPF